MSDAPGIVERLREEANVRWGGGLGKLLDEGAANIVLLRVEFDHLRSAAQKARTALSSLIASGDRVVFSDALTALDEVLGEPIPFGLNPTEHSSPLPDAADEGSGIGSGQ